MSLQALKDQLPDTAKDIKLNVASALESDTLTTEQAWGTAVAVAYAMGNKDFYTQVVTEAAEHIDDTHINAAKTAASLMNMNNIYYRFVHLVENPEYGKMPARLRMNGMTSHGIAKADFELYSLAISAINGCGLCMASHEKMLKKEGISSQQVQDAVRIAAILHAAAKTLELEG